VQVVADQLVSVEKKIRLALHSSQFTNQLLVLSFVLGNAIDICNCFHPRKQNLVTYGAAYLDGGTHEQRAKQRKCFSIILC
jgi:hypothetical protein